MLSSKDLSPNIWHIFFWNLLIFLSLKLNWIVLFYIFNFDNSDLHLKNVPFWHHWYPLGPISVYRHQHRDSHYKDKMVSWLPYHYDGNHQPLKDGLYVEMGLWWWYPQSWSSQCNSFEDLVLADEIYGYPIFKWIAFTWQGWEGTRIVVPAMATRCHPLLQHWPWKEGHFPAQIVGLDRASLCFGTDKGFLDIILIEHKSLCPALMKAEMVKCICK